MNKKYQEIQKSVYGKEFNKFCRKEISKNLVELEKSRILYLAAIFCLIFIAVIIWAGSIYYAKNTNLGCLTHNEFRIVTLIIICIFYAAISLRKSFKTKAKNIILEKLLAFIGDFRIEPDKNDINYIENLKLFDNFNIFCCDDRLKGTYNILKMDIQELRLLYETGAGRNKRVRTVFQGIFIKTPSLKKYEGYTVIKRKSINNSIKIIADKTKVNLEDPEFEKYYDVYSDNQVEARYLITAGFIERMVQLAKHDIGNNISLSFEHGNVNLAVASSKDWFEIPILKPATDITNYRAIVFELITILKIIDSLKLDVKIGL